MRRRGGNEAKAASPRAGERKPRAWPECGKVGAATVSGWNKGVFPISKPNSQKNMRHVYPLKRVGEAGARRKPPDQAEPDPDDASGAHEPHEAGSVSAGPAEAIAPTAKTTTGRPSPAASAREAHDPEPDPEKQAEGMDEGPRPAGQGEETNPMKPRPAPEEATADTSAAEREARRPASGTEGPPPAHQVIEAPAARAPATPETEETEEDASGAKARAAGQGGETGPNAAKTRSREDAPKASAEETTRASPPTAHPTATSRRGTPASTEPTTRETSAESVADAGRVREPQKPTIPATKITPWENACNAGTYLFPRPLPGGARPGGEKAPARRERKGGPRKVFAQQNPEANRSGRASQKVSGCPCAHKCRC
jgi:hypothetical protein